ncbi:MAG TPA: hypothetical protein VLG37_01640 [Candidatus Saccharimonadales bacterium]|nr:hypothetical protein [Candidatus Saccharimonadales bacterium]
MNDQLAISHETAVNNRQWLIANVSLQANGKWLMASEGGKL